MIIKTKNEQETQKFGQKLAKQLKGGEIIGLIGDLGSGKTTFVKGLAKGLGIKETVTSPTFVLMKEYRAKSLEHGGLRLVHIDLYRLEEINDIKCLGLEEYLGKPKYIVVIEWAEKIKKQLQEFSDKVIWVEFKYINQDTRKIETTK